MCKNIFGYDYTTAEDILKEVCISLNVHLQPEQVIGAIQAQDQNPYQIQTRCYGLTL